MSPEPPSEARAPRGVEHAHVIDIVAHDTNIGEVALIMLEPRPWDGSELRLFQLQEKINAYLSFALDGEMAETYPSLMHQPLRLQLDCASAPDAMTLEFLEVIREQVAFQGIKVEVRVMGQGCGTRCGCTEPCDSLLPNQSSGSTIDSAFK